MSTTYVPWKPADGQITMFQHFTDSVEKVGIMLSVSHVLLSLTSIGHVYVPNLSTLLMHKKRSKVILIGKLTSQIERAPLIYHTTILLA